MVKKMKIFFLSIWTLVLFIFVSVDAQGDPNHETDPLLLSIDVNSPRFLELPFTTIPSFKDKYADVEMLAACPADESTDLNTLRRVSKKAEYCLFEKIFKPDERKSCRNPVRPMIHTQYDEFKHEAIKCGTSDKHLMYEFGFYYCGGKEIIPQLTEKKKSKTPEKYIKPRFFPIYELCIDTSNHRALWTRYNIMTPGIFLNKDNIHKLISEHGGDALEIGTFELALNPESYFTSVKKDFEGQSRGRKNNNPIMKATFMVPLEHIAIRTWRKTVNHFINVAPLWETKDKLMIAINDGIKKIAFQLHREHQRLSIYTAVRQFNRKGKPGSVWSKVTKANLWIKLLYEEKNKLAAMIVVHSNPAAAPTTKICTTLTDCDTMKDWYVKRDVNDEDLLETDLGYAYCCDPKTTEIENIFKMYLPINGGLDLDTNFTKAKQYDSNPSSVPVLPAGEMAPPVFDKATHKEREIESTS